MRLPIPEQQEFRGLRRVHRTLRLTPLNTQINRDSSNTNPAYDAAGNTTSTPVRPGSGVSAGQNVALTAVYDTYNHLMRGEAGSNEEQHYRYDPFGRRIAAMELASTTITKGRRYIFDGSRVVTERLFFDGGNDPTNEATLNNGKSRLERIYVVGSILFCAIDHNGDGDIADGLNNFNEECLWEGGLESLGCSDAAFYYYTDASGRVAALGDSHPDNSHKILEYYRYRAFGEMITLPVVDEPTIIEEEEIPSDGIEDTPTSLTDNNAYMLTLRGTYGAFVGRVSAWGNEFVRAGGRIESSTSGLFNDASGRYHNYLAGNYMSGDKDPVDIWDKPLPDKAKLPYKSRKDNIVVGKHSKSGSGNFDDNGNWIEKRPITNSKGEVVEVDYVDEPSALPVGSGNGRVAPTNCGAVQRYVFNSSSNFKLEKNGEEVKFGGHAEKEKAIDNAFAYIQSGDFDADLAIQLELKKPTLDREQINFVCPDKCPYLHIEVVEMTFDYRAEVVTHETKSIKGVSQWARITVHYRYKALLDLSCRESRQEGDSHKYPNEPKAEKAANEAENKGK